MYIVGIDIAKKSHQAAIMKPDGTLVGIQIYKYKARIRVSYGQACGGRF